MFICRAEDLLRRSLAKRGEFAVQESLRTARERGLLGGDLGAEGVEDGCACGGEGAQVLG